MLSLHRGENQPHRLVSYTVVESEKSQARIVTWTDNHNETVKHYGMLVDR